MNIEVKSYNQTIRYIEQLLSTAQTLANEALKDHGAQIDIRYQINPIPAPVAMEWVRDYHLQPISKIATDNGSHQFLVNRDAMMDTVFLKVLVGKKHCTIGLYRLATNMRKVTCCCGSCKKTAKVGKIVYMPDEPSVMYLAPMCRNHASSIHGRYADKSAVNPNTDFVCTQKNKFLRQIKAGTILLGV